MSTNDDAYFFAEVFRRDFLEAFPFFGMGFRLPLSMAEDFASDARSISRKVGVTSEGGIAPMGNTTAGNGPRPVATAIYSLAVEYKRDGAVDVINVAVNSSDSPSAILK